MTMKFSMTRDINGYNGFGLIPADLAERTTLSQGVAQEFVVPNIAAMGGSTNTTTQKWLAIMTFEPGASVWVTYNSTATLPGSSVTGTNCELNPVARMLDSGETISLITGDATAQCGVVYYAL